MLLFSHTAYTPQTCAPAVICLDDILPLSDTHASSDPTHLPDARSPHILFMTVNTSTTSFTLLHTLIASMRKHSRVLLWQVRPLTAEQIRALATQCLPMSTIDDPACAFLASQSAGNPLLLIELIRPHLLTHTRLTGRTDFALVQTTNILSSGPSLLAHARVRIGNLTLEERHICTLLAVADTPLSTTALTSLCALDGPTLDTITRTLTARGVLRAHSDGSDEQFSLAGQLLCDYVLTSVTGDDKQRLHHALATYYLSATDQRQSIALAAKHLVASGHVQEGVSHYAAAARQAMDDHNYVAALTFLEAALLHPIHLASQHSELQLLKATTLFALGHAIEAIPLLRPIVDDRSLTYTLRAEAHILLGRLSLEADERRTHMRSGRRAVILARMAKDAHLEVRGYQLLGAAHTLQERLGKGPRLLFRTARRARRLRERAVVAGAMNSLAFAAWRGGKHSDALRYTRRRVGLIRTSNDGISLSEAIENQAIIQTALGFYGSARQSLRHSLFLAQQHQAKAQIAGCHANIGETFRCQGSWPMAAVHPGSVALGAEALGWQHGHGAD